MRKTEDKQQKERKKQAPKKNKVVKKTKEEKNFLPLLSYKTFKDVQKAIEKKEVAFGVRPQAFWILARNDIMTFGPTFFCNFLLGLNVILFIPFSIIMGIYTGISWWYFASIPAFLGNFLASPYWLNYNKDFSVIGTVVFVFATYMGWETTAIMAFIFSLFGIMSQIGRIICQVKIEKIVLEDEELFAALWNDSQIYILHNDTKMIENLRITSFLVKAYEGKKAYEAKDEESKKEIESMVQRDVGEIQYKAEYATYCKPIFDPGYAERIQFFFLTLFIVLLCKSCYILAVISLLLDLIIHYYDKKAKKLNWYYGKNS